MRQSGNRRTVGPVACDRAQPERAWHDRSRLQPDLRSDPLSKPMMDDYAVTIGLNPCIAASVAGTRPNEVCSMSAFSSLAFVFGLLAAQAAHETIPPEMLTKIKACTVFVKAKVGRIETSGSGFVIRTDGDAVYVATNHHVVNPRVRVTGSKPVLTIVFDSGTREERSAPGELLASDPSRPGDCQGDRTREAAQTCGSLGARPTG